MMTTAVFLWLKKATFVARCCLLPLSPVSCPIERERRKRIFPTTVEATDLKPPDEKNLNQNSSRILCPSLKTTFSKPSLMSPLLKFASPLPTRRGDSAE